MWASFIWPPFWSKNGLRNNLMVSNFQMCSRGHPPTPLSCCVLTHGTCTTVVTPPLQTWWLQPCVIYNFLWPYLQILLYRFSLSQSWTELESEFSPPALVMATRTAWKRCHDWSYKGCKVQPGFHFSSALREWESLGIWLSTLGNAAYVPTLSSAPLPGA